MNHDPHGHDPHTQDPHAPGADAHEPDFKGYMRVFIALMILTLASFGAYVVFGQGQGSMWIILAISVVKATLVALIFMHLKFDWPKLYCIVIPVCIMAVMMMIVLLPDGVITWHQIFALYK